MDQKNNTAAFEHNLRRGYTGSITRATSSPSAPLETLRIKIVCDYRLQFAREDPRVSFLFFNF